jgi:hypothetical protein
MLMDIYHMNYLNIIMKNKHLLMTSIFKKKTTHQTYYAFSSLEVQE